MRSSSVCAVHSRDRVCVWKDGSGCVAHPSVRCTAEIGFVSERMVLDA